VQNQEEQTAIKDIVQDLLDEAKKQGASAAEAGLSQENGLSVSVRLGDVETIEHHCSQGLGVTVYFGQRKGSASTLIYHRHLLKKRSVPLAVSPAIPVKMNFQAYRTKSYWQPNFQILILIILGIWVRIKPLNWHLNVKRLPAPFMLKLPIRKAPLLIPIRVTM
jgi:hypothetical protein